MWSKHLYKQSAVIALVVSMLFAPCSLANQPIKVVYPNPKNEIPASSTFIVGAIEPDQPLTCNDEKVRVNEQGFFAHVVKLAPGKNHFVLNVGNGAELKTLEIKREIPTPPIGPNENKLRRFEPARDLGVKTNDIINLSVHATPFSQVVVQLGAHQITLREAAAKKKVVAARGRKRVQTRKDAHVAYGQDVAYGQVFQRSSGAPSDLYTGFYRVSADDHWAGIKPSVTLTHKDQSTSLTPSTRIWTIAQPAIAQTAHPQTVTRLGPGLARTTPLDEGVRLEVDGWVGTQIRCRYGESLHVWIEKKDLVFETDAAEGTARTIESAPAPWAIARTVNIVDDDYGQSVQIPLTQRLPYQVEQKLTPNLLVLKMFGVTADTDWVTTELKSASEKGDASPVDHVSWRQASDDVYELMIHLRGHRQWGYKVDYEGTTLCLGVKKQPQLNANERPLSGLKICLDPGHGGSEIGSTGCSGIHESILNLAIAEKLQPLLTAQGALVTMTRNNDTLHSLEERVKIANEHKVDLLLSIHNNGLPDGSDPWKQHGTSTYWYHPQSIEFARCLRDSMVESLGFPDLGARYQNLALARPSAMPAVLAEVGFMVHPDEYAKLIDPAFQEKIAHALCNAIVKYFHTSE